MYQQNKGKPPEYDSGYIKKAYNCGMDINTEKAEPNQKWHLLNSYYGVNEDGFDINDKELDKDADIWCMGNIETGKGGPGLKCPELLLWIAEAAGVNIEKAKVEAEKLCEKGERLLACNAIKQTIPWKVIKCHILCGK